MALHPTACRGCRRRGRKCDRTLPSCVSCTRRGVPCEGYITRWPGVAARGKLAGKSIPVHNSLTAAAPTTASRDKRARPFPSKPTELGCAPFAGPSKQKDGIMEGDEDDAPSTTTSRGSGENVTESDIERLANHCMASPPLIIHHPVYQAWHLDVEDLSSIFYLGSGLGQNPMFRYVLPLRDTVPAIRYALAASASCHMAARTSDDALEQTSLYLRVRATQFLRNRLKEPTLATDQATMASILMLAQVDVRNTPKSSSNS